MNTALEQIAPQVAREYREKADPQHQRKYSPKKAQAFAREMVARHWYLNHQGIAFDDKGRLIDGQHRMGAIEICGLTIPMLVTRGIPSEMVNGIKLYAIDTIDVGYKRKTGEQLALRHEIENANRVAAATRTILHWATGIAKNTTPIALEILKLYPSIKQLASHNQCKISNGVIIGCLAVGLRSFSHLQEDFIDPFFSGAGLGKNSPALTLRNALLNSAGHSGGAQQGRMAAWAFNALLAATRKESCRCVKNNDVGAKFFAELQKNLVRKIKLCAGVTETTTEEK